MSLIFPEVLKRFFVFLLTAVGLLIWTNVVFHSGRLMGSTQTLEYQARVSNDLLGIDHKTLSTYMESARFILHESSWRLLDIRE